MQNNKIKKLAIERQNELLKPNNSLGLLEDLAIFYCGWRGSVKPEINYMQTIIFAGNHGICNQSVNSFPQEVTAQMVQNFRNGKAAINQISEEVGSSLEVIDIDLDKPTKDFTKEPAMSEREFFKAFNIGYNSVKKNTDVLALGEMGIGNTTIASAIIAALIGGKISKWVGRGTSQDNNLINHKISIIEKGLDLNKNKSPLEILTCLGGREQAAIFGATIRARLMKIPVIIDGFICSASILPLFFINKNAIDHCIFGHCSAEKGHKLMLDHIGKHALLNLKMCLGEGTGSTLALNILKSALACHNQMGTFTNSGVSNSIN
tara:strand:+ start:1206 stop:2165 length:960 start_codon:yes stop_codon:yes gene_type:complete